MNTPEIPQGMAYFSAVLRALQALSPGFVVEYKNESKLQRLIGTLLFFNKTFMTAFITTFFHHSWFPSVEFVAANPDGAGDVLWHEGTHDFDEQRLPLRVKLGSYQGSLLYQFLYLFPASLGAMVFGAGLFFLLLGIFVHAVLPLAWLILVGVIVAAIPIAPFRMQIEMRGYGMSLLICYMRGMKKGSEEHKAVMAHYASMFTGPNYYFMWPFKASVQKRLEAIWSDIESGRIYEGMTQEPYRRARDFFQNPPQAPQA